jgi:hypothetical protein
MRTIILFAVLLLGFNARRLRAAKRLFMRAESGDAALEVVPRRLEHHKR